MADRNPSQTYHGGGARAGRISHPIATFLHNLQCHAPNSTQLFGFVAFLVAGGILLFLTGVTVTAAILGFIAFLPLIVISSPIWVPIFVIIAGFLSVTGFFLGFITIVSWLYRYLRGMHPVGSDQVDYARSRIYDTAAHVKDYAREYGGYLQSKMKDAAPGA